MNIAVLGGRGYVGSAVTAVLRDRDHAVTTIDPGLGGAGHVSVSILSDKLEEVLDGFDVVVNLVGLSPMRQPGVPGYNDLHVAGAENVVGACEANDVERLVHMSALGADPASDIAFLRTKGLGEEAVLDADLELETTVFRPSVIFDRGNEIVEQAARFAPLRMFPQITTPLQPIHREDVAFLFSLAAHGEIDEPVIEIGGPETMSMFQFAQQVFNARGYRCLPLPVEPLMKLTLPLLEYVPLVPFGRDQARFLDVENVTEDNAAERYLEELTRLDDWLETAF